jgi:hypothetical protein
MRTVNLESIVFFAQTKLDGEEITLNKQTALFNKHPPPKKNICIIYSLLIEIKRNLYSLL